MDGETPIRFCGGIFFYIDIEGKKEAGKKSRRNLERFAGDF